MRWCALRRRLGAVLVGGAAIVLAVTACSSSKSGPTGGSSTSNGGSQSSSGGTAATGSPIKVMLITDDSSVQPLADVTATAKGTAAEINAAGGVNGHPIQVDFCSGKLDPNTTLQCAQKVVSGDYVATVGTFMAADQGASKALATGGVAQLGSFPVSQDAYSCDTCYPVVGGSITSVAGMTMMCPDVLHANKIGMAQIDIPAGRTLPALIGAVLKAHGGPAKIAKVIYIPPTATDYSSYTASLLHSGAQCIAMPLPRLMGLSFTRASATQGGTIPLTSNLSSMNADDFPKLGSAASNLYMASEFRQTGAAHDDFIKIEQAAGGGIPIGGDNAANAYVAVKLLAAVAKTVHGAITRQSLAAAAKTFHWDGGGMTGSVNLGAYNSTLLPGFPRLITSTYYTKVVNGKLSPLCGGALEDVTKPATGC